MLSCVNLKLSGNKTLVCVPQTPFHGQGEGSRSGQLLKEYQLSSMAVECRMLECLQQLLLEEMQLTAE